MSMSGFGGLFAGAAPNDLGVRDGRLMPCPDTPNCVHSQEPGHRHIRPFRFRGEPEAAMQRLRSILTSMPRTRIVAQTPSYLRAEVRSRLLGFVDDVEFFIDAADSLVHIRSASRLGHSDFGVNRKRIEAIRARFE